VREEQFSLLPGVADAVTALKKDGHACVVVTNQNARRKGLLSATTLDAVHASLRREVPVDDIFVATGLNDAPALKPSPDLVNLALESCGGDRENAVLVGDSRTDMIAACRAGILAVLVTSSHHGVACAAELAEAPTPAIIDGGAPGGLLREGTSVAAVFPGLPQALAAIRAHASRT
jgi:HAD superfamily hydrolase (TIGR01662 family)